LLKDVAIKLGDLLAGTMVVREGSAIDPAQRTPDGRRMDRARGNRPVSTRNHARHMNVGARQLEIIERFLARRGALPAASTADDRVENRVSILERDG